MGTLDEGVSPFARAADILDPPEWDVADRAPLEPHQVPPAGDWTGWLLEGSRGAGKTEACARYFARWMRRHPLQRGRIIGPTFADAVTSCIEGPSGLLTLDPAIRWLPSAPGGSKVVWPNGSEALVIGTPSPRDVDRLRAAGNRHIDWWEEMAANTQLGAAFDQAAFGLRLGRRPHWIGSTTPRPRPDYRRIREGEGVRRTHGTIDDNPHLSQMWVSQMRARYGGTRLGRQELGGELIEDIEGALWSWAAIEAARAGDAPELVRVVVAVDPAVSAGPDADDTGIIVAGLGIDGHGYVLADHTCHLAPEAWGHRVIQTFHDYGADRVVAEVNNGGDLVATLLRGVDSSVPVKQVRASRGKQIRAEPIAALYGKAEDEDGPARPPRVHHVGALADLESQLTTWVPGDAASPDRLDALVWAISDLLLGRRAIPDVGPVSVAGASAWRG